MTDIKWVLKHERLGDKPWAVQVEAMRRRNGKPHYGYFLDMGLGKTALILNEFMCSPLTLLLVVAPNSFKLDWPNAPAEWGFPAVKSGYWPKTPMPLGSREKMVYAINYESARSKKITDQLCALMQMRPTMLVFDEASAMDNYTSSTSKACLLLSRYAREVRVLDGTPMTKDASNYYMKLRVLQEYNGWNPVNFRKRYVELGGYMGKQSIGIKNEHELAEGLAKCSFRALKADWRKDLPPQLDADIIHLEMDPRQRAAYRSMLHDFCATVDKTKVNAEMVITQMSKLQQISSGFMMKDGEPLYILPAAENPKIRAVTDMMKLSPVKTIVFYVHTACASQLMEQQKEFAPAFIRGGMKPEELVEQKRRFNDDSDCRVMVAQLSAGARGHTLFGKSGDRCTRTIYYENSFKLGDRLQSRDRNHRGEQDQACIYYDLACSPADIKPIIALRERKEIRDMVDELVTDIYQGRFEL